MSTPLTIVAEITAEPGCQLEVEQALQAAVAPTLAEDGCLQYDLHRDLNKPGLFLFYENWASRPQWEAHMRSEHLAAMHEATAGKVKQTVIWEMERI
jgi:quinol monooxygenase YgiN